MCCPSQTQGRGVGCDSSRSVAPPTCLPPLLRASSQEGASVEDVEIFTRLTQRFESSFFDDMEALKVGGQMAWVANHPAVPRCI